MATCLAGMDVSLMMQGRVTFADRSEITIAIMPIRDSKACTDKTIQGSEGKFPMIAKRPNIAQLRKPPKQETVIPETPIVSPETALEAMPDTLFTPKPVSSIKQSGLTEAFIESLVFKSLMAAGHLTGRGLATEMGIPPKPIIEMLASLKTRQLVQYKDSTAMGDFEYALTDAGRMRARTFLEESTYVGKAPVTLESYINSVTEQSITKRQPTEGDLVNAFSDLLINPTMFSRLGPAINSGRGLFLYGFPGNGKTSIAERITACFGDNVWVPYAINAGGEIITLFDPENHEVVEPVSGGILKGPEFDPRWILIKRPTIVVGGELVMESLDLCHNPATNITEPSLQLKSNTGTLVIDDFGRQRMSPLELLNRWIVPLEKRFDFLQLANGKKIKVPFDQLIIFSTNLEPKDLVDEAFLRRIPYKINVIDPTEEEFRKLFDIMGPIVGVEITPDVVDYLVETHYRSVERPFRCCQPRDLLLQVKNTANYKCTPMVATKETIDAACDNYFAVM
jgi:hypothetical protein